MKNPNEFYLSDQNLTPLELHDAQRGTGKKGAWPLVKWLRYLIAERRKMAKTIEILSNKLSELEYEVYNGIQGKHPTQFPTGEAPIARALSAQSDSGGIDRNSRTGYPE